LLLYCITNPLTLHQDYITSITNTDSLQAITTQYLCSNTTMDLQHDTAAI